MTSRCLIVQFIIIQQHRVLQQEMIDRSVISALHKFQGLKTEQTTATQYFHNICLKHHPQKITSVLMQAHNQFDEFGSQKNPSKLQLSSFHVKRPKQIKLQLSHSSGQISLVPHTIEAQSIRSLSFVIRLLQHRPVGY